MENYRFFVRYEGTKYDGWQRQMNTDKTIQGKLEAVLGRLFEEPVEIQGSGRTDAGVHALGQVANFRITSAVRKRQQGKRLEPKEIEQYLNQYLPEDICVYDLEQVPERFHSRLSAVGKTYCYRIFTSERKPVFERRYVWWLPGEWNIEAMRQAAERLCGTHDYVSFCGNPKMKKSTVRTVDKIEISEQDGMLTLRFHGDGFLQNMVRILTGTLAEVGLGRRNPESMNEILGRKQRTAAGPMAPAQGLCLESVDYEEERKNK